MGRISDIIPSLYYDKQNDLIRFVDCLDVEIKELERKVRGISDIVNIDKCPDDKLPYLAALTNCPLMGNNPVLWRKQIRNWPYILKIKGTPLSLDIFLNSIDVDEHKLYTFFRDAEGNLVEEKPEDSPFLDSSGLWCNIRTHYFDLDILYGVDHYQTWTEWHSDFLRSMNIWLTKAKPFHSELRNLRVFLQGISEIQHFVGTATGQAYRHDIAPVKPTPSSSTQLITAGAGIMHRPTHDVRIIWSTGCNIDVGLKIAQGVSQGQYHEIVIMKPPRSCDLQPISIAGTVQQKPQHDIEFIPAHSASAEAHISAGGIVACGVYTQITMAA